MKNISDEQLKAYFLGTLPEPEAESLEIECASEAELFERSQMAERELTDDYVRGNLSAAEIRLYETNYLTTEARQENLKLAAQLWKLVADKRVQPIFPVASSASPSPFWQKLFGGRRAFGFAFGSLFVLLACGALAFYLLTSSVNKSEIAQVADPLQTAKPETPAIETPENQPAVNLAPENQPPKPVSPGRSAPNKEPQKDENPPLKDLPETKNVSSPKAFEPFKPAVLMTVKLLPGSLRADGEQFINIAPDVKNLQLLLSPAGEPNNYKIYRATIKTPESGAVFTASNPNSLSFKIAADKLENRTYIISLEGKNAENEFESIADYTLRVRR